MQKEKIKEISPKFKKNFDKAFKFKKLIKLKKSK